MRALRIAHDVGLAALLGGELFGRLALHPAVRDISDKSERGEVVSGAWRRYGTVNAVALTAVGAGWLAERGEERDALGHVRDALMVTVVVAGLAAAVEGMRLARQAPHGAVPLEDGDTAAAEATGAARHLKDVVTALGTIAAGAELGLVAVNAARRS